MPCRASGSGQCCVDETVDGGSNCGTGFTLIQELGGTFGPGIAPLNGHFIA